VDTSRRIRRQAPAIAASLALVWSGLAGAQNGAGSGTSSTNSQVSTSSGGLFSSLQQAFSQDADREVIRGHFDVGSPPKTRRYYCLIDPKTGKTERNGVAGEPVHRRDGMTGIKAAAVSPLSCADAEQKGLLVTTGYIVKGSTAGATAPLQAQGSAAAAAAAVPGAVAAPAAALAPTAAAVDTPTQKEVRAVYVRFIAAQNAHDRAAVSEVLLDSKDFLWAPYAGNSVWGTQQALAAFEQEWKGTLRLEPQLREIRIANVSPGVAMLIAPVLFTAGRAGEDPATLPVRWGGVFVQTKSGWRISSIFITPFKEWSAAGS